MEKKEEIEMTQAVLNTYLSTLSGLIQKKVDDAAAETAHKPEEK